MSPKDKFIFNNSDLPLVSFRTFNEMRSKGDLCDVTFRVENLQIAAHRLILAASIPYFRVMFLGNMAERNQAEINFEGMDSDTFTTLIYFAYGCQIEISLANVMSLIVGASFLQMDQVCNACCEFLSGKINLHNVLDLREFAGTHGFNELQQSTDEYLQSHFAEISGKEEFLDLPFPYFRELISKDELCVPSEELVFQVVMSWVKRSVAQRRDKLPELLSAVRMTLLSYRFLSGHVASEELIQNSIPCQNLLEEAKDYRILREKTSVPCSFITRPRHALKSNNLDNYLYAVCRKDEGFPYVFVERFDLKVRRWTTMEAKTMYVEDTTIASIGKRIYVIGGTDRQGKVLDIVQVFDTESDAWGTAALLRAPKRLVAAAVLYSKLYICGGQTEKGAINDVECYCSSKNEWTGLPPMLQYRSAACAAPCGVYLYVMGGYGGDSVTSTCNLRSVERYDTEIRQWSLVSEMSCVPYRCGVTSLNGKIYAHSEECFEVYDQWTRKWVKIFYVGNNKCGFCALALGQKICAICEDGRMCIYDPGTSEWSVKEHIPGKVHVIGAATGRDAS